MNTLALAAEITRRIPAMNDDCAENNQTLIHSLIRAEIECLIVCEWKYGGMFFIQTDCKMEIGNAHLDAAIKGKFKHCPHCGGKLKLPTLTTT